MDEPLERENRNLRRKLALAEAQIKQLTEEIQELREKLNPPEVGQKRKINPNLILNPTPEQLNEAVELFKSSDEISYRDVERQTNISKDRVRREIKKQESPPVLNEAVKRGPKFYFEDEDYEELKQYIEVREVEGRSVSYEIQRSHTSTIGTPRYNPELREDAFIYIVMKIHNDRLDRQYGKGGARAELYKPPSRSTLERIMKKVAEKLQIHPVKGVKTPRRFAALNDILNSASFAVMLDVINIDNYRREFIFNFDKSSSGLNLTISLPVLSRKKSRAVLKKHNRNSTVAGENHNVRGISYGALTSADGLLNAFIVYVKDNAFNKSDMNSYKLSGK